MLIMHLYLTNDHPRIEYEGKLCAGIQVSKDQQAFLRRGGSQRVHGRDSRYLMLWEQEQI